MQIFDPELWRDRAIQRFRKACEAGRHCAEAYVRDLRSIDQMIVLIEWCYSRKLQVVFGSRMGGFYERSKKLITINGRASPEKQLHILMHECGHHLIGKPSPEERFGLGYQAIDPGLRRSTVHRIDIVDEELEAWARGLRLTKRLGITLDLDSYNKTRSEYVKTYLKWAVKVEGWQLNKDDDEKE